MDGKQIIGRARELSIESSSISESIKRISDSLYIMTININRIHNKDKRDVIILIEYAEKLESVMTELSELSDKFEAMIKQALEQKKHIFIYDQMGIGVEIVSFVIRVGWDFDLRDKDSHIRGFKLYDLSNVLVME